MFRKHLDVFLAGLLDDMIIYSPSPEEHVPHVRAILALLRENKLYAMLEKCQFHTDTIDFLGYRVSPAGVGMDPEKVASLLDWPTPQSVKEVQSFLGFANFYRRFIDGYSTMACPLTSLTRKGAKFG